MNAMELSDGLLDCWVAFAEGHADATLVPTPRGNVCRCAGEDGSQHTYSPSTRWALATPIIEREGIRLREMTLHGEPAFEAMLAGAGVTWFATGALPLVAAMRVYVRSRIPEPMLNHAAFCEKGLR
jgi:hypothetical protein